MFRLALPVVIAELGWVMMGVVDVIMVGRVSAEAIGGVGVGSSVILIVAIFAVGMQFGLDYLVSHAYGAGKLEECHRYLLQGVYLGAISSVPMLLVLWLLQRLLPSFGIDALVLPLATDYIKVAMWSLVPLLLYTAIRRYLQAINIVKPIMFTLLAANLVNAGVNWILIYGNLGAPALGSTGAAYGTTAAKTFMFLALLGFLLVHAKRHQTGLFTAPRRLHWGLLRRMVSLGLPVGVHIALEVGIFATATILAGILGAVSLAAHQIVLRVASFTFMVPLGISAAGAVRVGQFLGMNRPEDAFRAGWTALAMGVCFMAFAALVFVTVPEFIMHIFTIDPAVIKLGVSLFFLAALFQIFDGTQVIATGILRGTGETRIPMLCNLVGYWGLGMPVAYLLGFRFGLDVQGIWIGLTASLILVAIALLLVWRRRVTHMLRARQQPAMMAVAAE